MTTTRRSVLWPLIIIAVGCIWLLIVADAFPEAVGDILIRAWPALLVLFGFDVLVGRRRVQVARWALDLNLIGLALSFIFLVIVVWLAYQKQADVLRTDNQMTFAEMLPDDAGPLVLDVAVDRTAVTITAGPGETRDLSADFKGSKESEVRMVWAVETGTLKITETHRDSLPKLEDYGRGALKVVLPPAVAVDQMIVGSSYGDMALDLLPLRVEQIDVTLSGGGLSLTLPAQDTLVGKLRLDGDLELLVPDAMALTLQAHGGATFEYDSFRYALLVGGQLERRNTGGVFQISLEVWLPDGAILTVTDLGE